MGNNKKKETRSRRSFLSMFFPGNNNEPSVNAGKNEKVKMLTADGKLVEIDQDVLDNATKNKKATNQEIFHWMKNPSKKNS